MTKFGLERLPKKATLQSVVTQQFGLVGVHPHSSPPFLAPSTSESFHHGVCAYALAVGVGGTHTPAASAEALPPSVTRGESTRNVKNQQASKVDWLNCTFPQPERYTPRQLMDILGRMFRRPIRGLQERGIFGFQNSIKMLVRVGSSEFPIGCLAYGGEDQKGRVMLQLTGAGCTVVRDWARLARLLSALSARITRLDLAMDYLDGRYTVDDAVAMYAAGQFTSMGRKPSTSVAGDWLEKINGRTLYIGKAANGKMLRVYEKGIQLGDLSSPWVRFEVQLGNRDRVIPFAAMVKRDEYLAGCYPALESMLGVVSEPIKTTQTAGHVTLGHLMFHLKRSYGKLLNTVHDLFDVDPSLLVESVRVLGAPRRVPLSVALVPGLTWEELCGQFFVN